MESSCIPGAIQYHTIVYYSHLMPLAISFFLGIFVLIKSKFSLLSKVFFLFVLTFCLWLIGDNTAWLAPNYHLVTFSWASLDYLNILFYVFAAYFFAVFARNEDIRLWEKFLLLFITIPAWWITFNGQSITLFNQPTCEALNNTWLTNYKFFVESIIVAYIAIYCVVKLFTKEYVQKKQILVISSALILFLLTFSVTEYFSSTTGIYEINLYSLFILPLFLALIIFSITNLKIFAFKSFGTQLLIYILLIMVGSQFFFLESVTNKLLTVLTFAVSLFLGIVLAKNIRREEILAVQLQVSNEGQSNLIHIMNHQIKGYLAKSRNIFSELLTDRDYEPISANAKPLLKEGLDSLSEGVEFVQQVLNGSSAESGTLMYSMKPMDLKEVVVAVANHQEETAKNKNLTYEVVINPGEYLMKGDQLQLREAVRNLIDNSIRYTMKGGLKITLAREPSSIIFKVSDTGVGITSADKLKLFTKGGRGKDSLKYNVNSTGYGLSFVKAVVEAHKGRVWADSEGTGKGSTFTMELPIS